MGVIYILFHPFIIWAAMGLQSAHLKPKPWAVTLTLTAFIAGFGLPAIGSIEIPDDKRYYQAWTGEREEDPAYVAAERRHVLDVAAWPDYGRLGSMQRVFHPEKLSGLLRDIRDPTIDQEGTPYGWFPGESVQPDEGSVVVELDFSQRLFDRTTPFVTTTDGPADIDLSTVGPATVVPNIAVDWSPRPMTVLLSRGQARVTGISLIFEKWGDDSERRAYLHERYHRGLQMVLGWSASELLSAVPITLRSQRIRIRVPTGPFSIIESVNNAGQNYLYWYSYVDRTGAISMEGPQRVFHN